MDEQSGESEVLGEGIGESAMEELVPEWGWQRDKKRRSITKEAINALILEKIMSVAEQE